MKKLIWTLFLIVSVSMLAYGEEYPAKEPYKFPYETLPFGKTEDEVLRLVESQKVTRNDEPSFETIGRYQYLKKYFGDGIYSWAGVNYYLNKNIVRSYTISYDKDQTTNEVNLYFVKDYNNEGPYTLFLVNKKLVNPGRKYRATFVDTMLTINDKLKLKGKVINTTYNEINKVEEEALISLWENKKMKTMLAIHSYRNMLGFPVDTDAGSDPEIIYVSADGWKKYLKGCKSYESKKRQEEKMKNSKTAKDI